MNIISRIKKLVLSTVAVVSLLWGGIAVADPVTQDLRWTNPLENVDGTSLMNLAKVTAYVSLTPNTSPTFFLGEVAKVEFIQTVPGAEGTGAVTFDIDNNTTTYTVMTATNTDDDESMISDMEIVRLWEWTLDGTTPGKILNLEEHNHTVICVVPEGWTCNVL